MSGDASGGHRRNQPSQHRNTAPPPPVVPITLEEGSATGAAPILQTATYIQHLRSLVHDRQLLANNGHTLVKLSNEALELKKRCSGCGLAMSKFASKLKKRRSRSELRGNDDALAGQASGKKAAIRQNGLCKFHSGQLRDKVWTCCGGQPTAPPCVERAHHIPQVYSPGVIEKLWQFHPTQAAKGKAGSLHQYAVAIDCEMGTAQSGDSELIRVTVLEYFSGKVLLDRLVWPHVPMTHFNTRFSGIHRGHMNQARKARTCLFGRESARRAVMNFVGPETVVVGHAVHNDLNSLRLIHHVVADTAILESERLKKEKMEKMLAEAAARDLQGQSTDDLIDLEASSNESEGEEVAPTEEEGDQPKPPNSKSEGKEQAVKKKKPKGSGPLSLKTLAKAQLGRDIQTGRKGHDSVEDALAARDLMHAYITTHGVSSIAKLA